MTSRILASAALVLCVMSSAQAAEKDFCKYLEGYAKISMDANQTGIPLSDLLKLIKDNGNESELVNDIAMDAYDVPRYSSEKLQQESIVEYQNRIYLKCLRATREKK
ncbi:hypothetical protein RBI14_15580 [Alcaligenaceae bacterium B3P038]|nr:hypothetical protein [Alcaligenaceae bacterium B3P038]